ncbi:MAG: glycoside hydrolase family 2 [Verrucomicrobia bacterium]|nr:glycoside hydrolase family 2 [Verrucomicrobiota bacterium]
MKTAPRILLSLAILASCWPVAPSARSAVAADGRRLLSLDGSGWLLATDPGNVGRAERWCDAPRPDARPTRVPWIIQDAFPGYHGVAWYWRRFEAPRNVHPGGRTLLRFWAVDYAAEVWLNGQAAGGHEGGEAPFVLDVTGAYQPGATNLLAVRVLNPTHTPIDGIVLNETPHRNKVIPYTSGSAWNLGGITDSVELLLAPAVRVEDLFVRPDPRTGRVSIRAGLRNAAPRPVACRLEFVIAPAASGETLGVTRLEREFTPGDTRVEAELTLASPRLWELNDPFLYRVTTRLTAADPAVWDEHSVRCGFREFRFAGGAFRLNGRRVYLRCSHTGNCTPVGLELPHDPDLLRRDLVNAKMMRFNAIRFIAGVPKRYQLDLCDELGLMVYEESYAAWCLADSPNMAGRYNASVLGMIRRDRNHPSVTIWGLLNETPDGPVFRHAAGLLPAIRQLDDSRLVMLNSGRWDKSGGGLAGIEVWRNAERVDPCVTRNGTRDVIRGLGITWAPGQLAFHPGRHGEYAVVRWTAPADDTIRVTAHFQSIAERATTDVHVRHNARSLFDGLIHAGNAGPEARVDKPLAVRRGDTVDCAVGYGNGDYGADTTALAVTITTGAGKTFDAARDFSPARNPNGAWSYGQLAPGPEPKPETFAPFKQGSLERALGTLSNPGSQVWEDTLSDQHPYQRVPHTADILARLRTLGGGGQPVFVSEYGIGSGLDLVRIARHYEQLGKTRVQDAQVYHGWLDQFLADYTRFRMDEVFPRPEDFFAASLERMATQRLLGLNAIRANPDVVGYSLTGTVDQGMTGEGLWTTFRELKPGTTDALFDGWAPLRWCLFVEPVNVTRGGRVRLEAVLANEDALPAGNYPVRLLVVGPNATRVWERKLTVTIPGPRSAPAREPPMVLPVFAEEITLDAPEGSYRFLADFERGGAAAGGRAELRLYDPARMPRVEGDVALWGEDAELGRWLGRHGIRIVPLAGMLPNPRPQVILASGKPPAPGGAEAFADLARRMAQGSAVVFLTPETLRREEQPTGYLPLANKGTLVNLPSWLYHKDEWCRRHPVFDGLPAGGLMDYTVYREIIPDAALAGQDPPPDEVIAAGNNVAQPYASGVFLAMHKLGAGRFFVNTLRLREHLDSVPVAERLLRNLLNEAARGTAPVPAALPAGFEAELGRLGYR